MMRGSSRTQEGLRGEGGDRHSTTGGSLCSRRHIPTTRLRRRVGREDSMFGEGRREKGEGRREKGRREKGKSSALPGIHRHEGLDVPGTEVPG